MSVNEEVLKSVVKDDYELIKKCWSPYALIYNPLKVGSIDGTDTIPHDCAIARAQDTDYKPNKKVKGRPECTLFVFRLSPSTTESTLRKIFANYGAIKRCRLVEDIVTGRSKCYGFIEFETERCALQAYKRANHLKVDGVNIAVDMECERLLPGWVPRRLGGGFCGRKESGQLRFGCRLKKFKKPIELMTEENYRDIKANPIIRSRLSDDFEHDRESKRRR